MDPQISNMKSLLEAENKKYAAKKKAIEIESAASQKSTLVVESKNKLLVSQILKQRNMIAKER